MKLWVQTCIFASVGACHYKDLQPLNHKTVILKYTELSQLNWLPKVESYVLEMSYSPKEWFFVYILTLTFGL